MSRLPALVVGGAILLVLAGCGTSSSEGSVLPPRPMELPINGIDSCAMFDAAQKKSLALRREEPTRVAVEGQPSAGCIWLTSSDLGYAVQTFPIPAEDAVTAPGAAVIQVNGFGAVRNVDRSAMSGGAPNCQVTIGVAPRESIRIQVEGSTGAGRSDDEMCRLATEAASMVMTTVVKNAG